MRVLLAFNLDRIGKLVLLCRALLPQRPWEAKFCKMDHAQENEEVVHIRPACAECTHRCNVLHGDRDMEEEKLDPDRNWPYFGRKLTKLALHDAPQAALCIPGTFSEEYPFSIPRGKPITLQGPSGNQWKVGATDRLVLHAGWRAFAYDHHLREGDHLYFRLTKPSHFTVTIFNSHGDVRKSARKATVTGKYAAPDTPPLMQGHTKKRKLDMTELAGIGKGVKSNGVDRRNTPAKRGVTSVQEPAGKLTFSEKTKQWESREEKDGTEEQVVTIDLDSDDERTPARSGKLEVFLGRVGVGKDGDFITPRSKVFAAQAGEDQKGVDAKSHQEITSDGEDDYVVQENEPFHEEEKQRPSDDPLRQFSNIFDATSKDLLEVLQETTKGTAEQAVVEAEMEKKIDSASDPLSRKAQVFCDEDMVTVKEEEDEDEDEELDKTTPQACEIVERKWEFNDPEQDTTPKEGGKKNKGLEADKATKTTTFPTAGQHSGTRDNRPKAEVLQSFKTPLAYKAAAADDEPVTAHNAVDSSPVTVRRFVKEMSKIYESTENSEVEDVNGKHNEDSSPGQMQEEEGRFSFGLSPDNDFEYPVVINSSDGDQTDSKHPLKQGLKQAGDEENLKQMEEDEQDPIESKTSHSIFEAHELDVTKTEPGTEKEENPNMPVLRENVKEKETALQSNIANPEFTTPEKEKNINIQARVASTTNTCVLESKRWQVFPFDREKALKAAQAWVRKIRNPNFTAVMKSSHVYTDFIMDIPADFAKHSNLPSHTVRVTLVCDEVPTNCKTLWLGSQSQLDCKGWRNFSRSHCLEEGDVCVFECFPPASPTMASIRLGVYIFRVVKLTRPILLDWTRHYKVLKGDNTTTGTANGSPSPSSSPSPSPAQARTPNGTNQAHEAYSKQKSTAGVVSL